MTNSLDCVEKADVILLFGSNTSGQHYAVYRRLEKAVLKGKKLIVVDPRRTPVSGLATYFLQINPGTDIALINSIMHVLIEEGLIDKSFINGRTEGFDKLKLLVEKFTPAVGESITGINRNLIINAARAYGKAGRGMIIYTLGITQHSFGTDNVYSLVNLALLTGNFGKEGTGINPLRGQANVQGTGDMGVLPPVLTGFQKVSNKEMRSKFEKKWGTNIPDRPGLTLSEMLLSPAGKKIKTMYIVGSNPAVSAPSLKIVRKRLEEMDLLIVQDLFLTETAYFADIVFPACSFIEKDGTFTNTERRVQRVRKAINPVGQSKPDWEIISNLSGEMGYKMSYTSSNEIFEEIRSLTPQYMGITYKRLEKDGIQWPCPSDEHPGTKYLHKDSFPLGKAEFKPVDFSFPSKTPDRDHPFILLTGRNELHAHTGTMTRRSKTISTIVPEGYVEINPIDATEADIKTGDKITISSERGKIKLKSYVTDKVKKGVLFTPFHFSEEPANALTGYHFDPVSKMPELKYSTVRIERAK